MINVKAIHEAIKADLELGRQVLNNTKSLMLVWFEVIEKIDHYPKEQIERFEKWIRDEAKYEWGPKAEVLFDRKRCLAVVTDGLRVETIEKGNNE